MRERVGPRHAIILNDPYPGGQHLNDIDPLPLDKGGGAT